MVRAQDIEDLNKATATAQMFNYESLRKQRLEQKLGLADDAGSVLRDSDTGTPMVKRYSTNKLLQIVSTVSEGRVQKQLEAIR